MTKQLIVTATTANGQPQQLIIAGTNQQITMNKGMVIATTANIPTQSQQQQQPQQQIVRSQLQGATTIQLQAPQPGQPVQPQQQQMVQQQPQQVQQQQITQQRPPIPPPAQQVKTIF